MSKVILNGSRVERVLSSGTPQWNVAQVHCTGAEFLCGDLRISSSCNRGMVA
ncbi:MAG: hypothetical protein ACI391_01155 [Muribaculaceae bacterium]